MSARLSREEIKRDEVRDTLLTIFEYLQENLQKILLAVGAVLLAVALIVGWQHLAERKELRAQDALAVALDVFQTPVDAEALGGEGFTDEAAKWASAEQAFETVRNDHSGSAAAEVADAYLAILAARKGDLATARERWSQYIERNADELLASELMLNLLAARRAAGDGEAVAGELEQMAESPIAPLPQDVVLGELAETLESLGRLDAARATFERIVEEHPDSAYAALARRQVGQLPSS